jgi:hypothetical protein
MDLPMQSAKVLPQDSEGRPCPFWNAELRQLIEALSNRSPRSSRRLRKLLWRVKPPLPGDEYTVFDKHPWASLLCSAM